MHTKGGYYNYGNDGSGAAEIPGSKDTRLLKSRICQWYYSLIKSYAFYKARLYEASISQIVHS